MNLNLKKIEIRNNKKLNKKNYLLTFTVIIIYLIVNI